MAHFAELDSNNVVLRVVVVDNKDTSDAAGVEKEYIGAAFCERLFGGNWKQTSYNGNFRKNYAGIGYTYDAELDEFVPPIAVETMTSADVSSISSEQISALTSDQISGLT
jgi:hypothetical protein